MPKLGPSLTGSPLAGLLHARHYFTHAAAHDIHNKNKGAPRAQI
jgi:hypothetical protein